MTLTTPHPDRARCVRTRVRTGTSRTVVDTRGSSRHADRVRPAPVRPAGPPAHQAHQADQVAGFARLADIVDSLRRARDAGLTDAFVDLLYLSASADQAGELAGRILAAIR